MSTAAWDTLMNVNGKGVFFGMNRHAGGRGGAIVNLVDRGLRRPDHDPHGVQRLEGAVRIMTKSARGSAVTTSSC